MYTCRQQNLSSFSWWKCIYFAFAREGHFLYYAARASNSRFSAIFFRTLKASFHCLLAPTVSVEMPTISNFVPPFSLPTSKIFLFVFGFEQFRYDVSGEFASCLCCTGSTVLCVPMTWVWSSVLGNSQRSLSNYPLAPFSLTTPPKTWIMQLNLPHVPHVSGVIFCVCLLSAQAWIFSTNLSSYNLILSSVL